MGGGPKWKRIRSRTDRCCRRCRGCWRGTRRRGYRPPKPTRDADEAVPPICRAVASCAVLTTVQTLHGAAHHCPHITATARLSRRVGTHRMRSRRRGRHQRCCEARNYPDQGSKRASRFHGQHLPLDRKTASCQKTPQSRRSLVLRHRPDGSSSRRTGPTTYLFCVAVSLGLSDWPARTPVTAARQPCSPPAGSNAFGPKPDRQ
jgi:hypothetical protein